ncbi:ISL3 family transposase, partial [Thiotrichales bacterium 19X7-9]|nr:ISL3 family transposase [Thiotrichales bacterium 19X7-9]
YLRIKAKRGICENCDDHPTTNQRLKWYDYKSRYTKAYLDYLMLFLVNSTLEDVAIKENLSADTINRILNLKVSESVDWQSFSQLGLLGIDEIATRKGYKDYLTIITSKVNDKVRIVSVLKGREKLTVKAFLKEIPSRLKRTIEGVCVDMNEGYINAIKETLKKVPIIIDRFHVAKKYRQCLVDVRKSELIRLRKKLGAKRYKELKPSIAILRRNAELVSKQERKELGELFRYSPKLRTAYRLCRQLTSIYNSKIGKLKGTRKIDKWILKVEQSDLSQFDTFITTLSKYKKYITNYFKGRHTSGFVEGFNKKIKVIKRRCYGIFDENNLFRRIFLDTEGYAKYLPKLRMA